MLVEAADGQTRLLHQVGNADPFQSLLAQPLGGERHDALMRLLLFQLRTAHRKSFRARLDKMDYDHNPYR